MSEYHKIETLYVRDEKSHKLVEPLTLKNPVYGVVSPWVWTEKIDGTNIRCIWDGERVRYGGKTDNANLPSKLVEWLQANVTAEKMASTFDGPAVLYGEGYGAGIQKGGGYRADQALILFDVRVGEWWLSDSNVRDVANKIGVDAVPILGTMPLAEAVAIVRAGLQSALPGATCAAEGMVGRPIEALFDKKGARLIVKLKTKDFA